MYIDTTYMIYTITSNNLLDQNTISVPLEYRQFIRNTKLRVIILQSRVKYSGCEK